MAHNMEYRVLVGAEEADLNKSLAELASDGWKPILMSSAVPGAGFHANQIVTTIIVEREKVEPGFARVDFGGLPMPGSPKK